MQNLNECITERCYINRMKVAAALAAQGDEEDEEDSDDNIPPVPSLQNGRTM
jgi:hypothetical protein